MKIIQAIALLHYSVIASVFYICMVKYPDEELKKILKNKIPWLTKKEKEEMFKKIKNKIKRLQNMDPTNRNTGVIEALPEPLDFIAGKKTGIVYREVLPGADWGEFLPKDETQFLGFETSACVTFSAHNVIETQIDFVVKTGALSGEKLQKLKDWGFFDETGRFNCSDRFTAKMSGTTKVGNTLKAVWDSIHNNGLVPEAMWPAQGVKTWEEWIAEIPQDIKDFGKNVLTILDIKYEWVVTGNCGAPDTNLLKYHLKQAPLQLAAPACPRGQGEVVRNCKVCVTQHATELYGIDEYLEQFDSYDSSRRLLAIDYLLPYVMKGVVKLKQEPTNQNQDSFGHTFTEKTYLGERSEEVVWLQKALIRLGFKTYATGYYGPITQAAVKAFQSQYQVAPKAELDYVNGRWVGPATRAKLN